MKLLLVESQPGIGRSLQEDLTAAGHHVATCYDAETNGPCRSVSCSAECPLDSHVDLAVVVRPDGGADTLFEMGAVCAERHRIPVVWIDPAAAVDAEERFRTAVAAGQDRIEVAYATAVRIALGHPGAAVEATRDPDRVQITVTTPDPCDATTRASVADRARAAVRSYDPFVRTIDVSVTSVG